jgi:hypothetical protein
MRRTTFAAKPRLIGPKIGEIFVNELTVRFDSGPRASSVRQSFAIVDGYEARLLREKVLMLGKHIVFLGLLGLAIGPVAAQSVTPTPPAAQAAGSPAPATERHLFDVLRDGDKIGTESVEIDRDGDTTKVKFITHISVVVMFIQAYHFDHSATETWTGGRFVSYTSLTDDNGTKYDVSAVAKDDKIDLDIDGTHSEAAPDLVPASWWSKDFVNRTDLLDSETGKPISVKVADLGDEPIVRNGATVQARHYKVSGDVNRDLWFDGDTLVRIQLIGSDHSTIISDLRPTPPASTAPPSATQE